MKAVIEGRHAYFVLLESSVALLDAYRPVRDAFYDSASDRMIAAHEAGHAALQAMKPSISTPAGLAFHEAFGDIAATGSTFSDESSVAAILAETSGDLRRSNTGSRIIDKLEDAVNSARVMPASMRRDATDMVTASSFYESELLESRDDGHMPEAHKLSRIVSTSVYALFASRASAAMASAAPDERVAAVRRVNDEVSSIVQDSIPLMPEDGGSLSDIACALLAAARQQGGTMAAELRTILVARGLLPDPARLPSSMVGLPQLRISAATSAAGILATPELSSFVASWPVPAGSTVLPVEDVTTAGGTRVIRLRYRRTEDAMPPTPQVWTAALTFDASGRLVAASHSA